MEFKRGDIWWASLSAPYGSQPGFRRPVLIVQSDDFNRSRIKTVMAVAVTSNLRLADAPGNLHLPAKSTGLSQDSVANVSQIITLDKSMFTEKVGRLNPRLLLKLEDGLRLVLSL